MKSFKNSNYSKYSIFQSGKTMLISVENNNIKMIVNCDKNV